MKINTNKKQPYIGHSVVNSALKLRRIQIPRFKDNATRTLNWEKIKHMIVIAAKLRQDQQRKPSQKNTREASIARSKVHKATSPNSSKESKNMEGIGNKLRKLNMQDNAPTKHPIRKNKKLE